MLNLTIDKLKSIAKGRSIDGYQNMSKKKELEDLLSHRCKIPISLPRIQTYTFTKAYKTYTITKTCNFPKKAYKNSKAYIFIKNRKQYN